jgi:hypothetical protein
MTTSHPLIRAPSPAAAVGQLGGHVKMGMKHPRGRRTNKPMALVSALPLEPGSDRLVLSFIDRTDPHETFDRQPHQGDNQVLIVPKAQIGLSTINGVCIGDFKGVKVAFGPAIEEPPELDADPTSLDLATSDRWFELVEELACDCSKLGGYALWPGEPVDVAKLMGRPQRFHHRIATDLINFKLGDGGVIIVHVDVDGDGGSLCWQESRS